MIVWLLAAIAVLLFAWAQKERFADPEYKVTRPSGTDPTWRSKIDAEAPIGGNDADYIRALQLFYDRVYAPSPTRPRDVDVEAFLTANASSLSGVDPVSLRKILTKAFHVDISETASAREEKQLVKTGVLAGFTGSNLQPGNARNEVYTRTELIYTPADTRLGDLPEGIYEPTQQTTPSRPGEFNDKSTSWTDVSPMSFCVRGDSECMKNVL